MSASSPTRRDSHVENPHHQHRWLILAVLGLAQLMVVLDATVVNIALPSAQKALGFSNDNRQWIITAYALAFGSLLLLGGRISDTYGRKWTFIGGLSGFAIASAVGGAAQSFDTLVAARAAQGVFGALLAPAALSLLSTTFTDGTERNQAFGIYSAIAGGMSTWRSRCPPRSPAPCCSSTSGTSPACGSTPRAQQPSPRAWSRSSTASHTLRPTAGVIPPRSGACLSAPPCSPPSRPSSGA
jgi:hypothetical protein